MSEPANSSGLASFVAELRRRRVVRVVILYVVVGWVVIEAASTMLPALHLPDWSVTLVTALLLPGFPIAVNLGWGDRAWMENDSDLDTLHDNPRFKALLAGLRV